jgi:hypothetical protein
VPCLCTLVIAYIFIRPHTANASPQAEAPVQQGLGSITGRITIQGKPAAGLAVGLRRLDPSSSDKAIANTETDKTGVYRFSGLDASDYWLKILDPQYVRADGVSSFDGSGRDVSVATNESAEVADLDLIPGGVVSGHIADSDGKPLAGEEVRLIWVRDYRPGIPERFGSTKSTLTNNAGDYTIVGICPGRYKVSIGIDIPRVS